MIVEGMRIGKLVAKSYVGLRPNGRSQTHAWLCICDCGGERVITAADLSSRRLNKTCGCENPTKRKDHTGVRYGGWTVIDQASRTQWLCRCDCGTERAVRTCHLRTGSSKGCGCTKNAKTSALRKKHGYSHNDPRGEYSIWCQMIGRCENPSNTSYRLYGARGIRVSPRWRGDFSAFLRDVGERPTLGHSIDRIDLNGHYEPGNVRWATAKQQARNTRRNRLVPLGGEMVALSEAVERLGLNYGTVKWRLNNGRSIEEALR